MQAQPNYFQYYANTKVVDYIEKSAPQMFTTQINGTQKVCFLTEGTDQGAVVNQTVLQYVTLLCADTTSGNHVVGVDHAVVASDSYQDAVGVVEHGGIAYVLTKVTPIPLITGGFYQAGIDYHISAIQLSTMSTINSHFIDVEGDVNNATIAFDSHNNQVVVAVAINANNANLSTNDQPGFQFIKFDAGTLNFNSDFRVVEDLTFYNSNGFFLIDSLVLSDAVINPQGIVVVVGQMKESNSMAIKKAFMFSYNLISNSVYYPLALLDNSSTSDFSFTRITTSQTYPISDVFFVSLTYGSAYDRTVVYEIELPAFNVLQSRTIYTGNNVTEFWPSSIKHTRSPNTVHLMGTVPGVEDFVSYVQFNLSSGLYYQIDYDYGDGMDELSSDFVLYPNGLNSHTSQSVGGNHLPKLSNRYDFCSFYDSTIVQDGLTGLTKQALSTQFVGSDYLLSQGFSAFQFSGDRFDCQNNSVNPFRPSSVTYNSSNDDKELRNIIKANIYNTSGQLLHVFDKQGYLNWVNAETTENGLRMYLIEFLDNQGYAIRQKLVR